MLRLADSMFIAAPLGNSDEFADADAATGALAGGLADVHGASALAHGRDRREPILGIAHRDLRERALRSIQMRIYLSA
ncbi:MAG TPA: hypothetical protein VGR63_08850 [Casimicrobiaceae bacterium]|jgi:hypothetical protein|nr:hypothetical protein [Casimicrobiaceae bacterium]